MSNPKASEQSLPRLMATTVFFDIDETITTSRETSDEENVLSTLIRVVARANRLDPAAAERKIRATFDVENEAVNRHYAALGITERQLWDALLEWFPKSFVGFPDAADTIRGLHARGFRLFPCTTNCNLICRLKLLVAGLGDFDGSPYFITLLGGSEVHPEGKTTRAFFEKLLILANAKPSEVVHVGDHPRADLALARAAGITQVVLPRRSQPQDWLRQPDGGIYVRSLDVLTSMIQLVSSAKRK